MPKNNHRQYRTVADLMRATAGEDADAAAAEFEQFVAERKLVKELAVLRSARGMSQQDLAESLGRSQGWVSKLENGRDDDLRIGDLRAYMGAIDLEFRAGAVKKGATCVDEVKQLAFAINARLHALAGLAKKDDGMVEHIALFFAETFCNLSRFLSEAAAKLPTVPQRKSCISVSLELPLPEETQERESDQATYRSSSASALRHVNEAALN